MLTVIVNVELLELLGGALSIQTPELMLALASYTTHNMHVLLIYTVGRIHTSSPGSAYCVPIFEVEVGRVHDVTKLLQRHLDVLQS